MEAVDDGNADPIIEPGNHAHNYDLKKAVQLLNDLRTKVPGYIADIHFLANVMN